VIVFFCEVFWVGCFGYMVLFGWGFGYGDMVMWLYGLVW
jgi:hypothetical protein